MYRIFNSEFYWKCFYSSSLFFGVFVCVFWYHLEILDVLYGALEDRVGHSLVVSGSMLDDFEYFLILLALFISYHLCIPYFIYSLISFSVVYKCEIPFSLIGFILTPIITLGLSSEYTRIIVSNNLGLLPSNLEGRPQLEDYLYEFIYVYFCTKLYLVPFYFPLVWQSLGDKVYFRFSICRAVLVSSGCGKVFIISLCVSLVIFMIIFCWHNFPSISSLVTVVL